MTSSMARQDTPTGSKEDLVKGQPVFRGFDPKAMTQEIEVPWHPGAIKFYKEIGQWPPKG